MPTLVSAQADCHIDQIQLNGASYHFQRKNYNEWNPGLGYKRSDICSPVGLGFSIGGFRNSYSRDSLYALGTVNYNLISFGAGGWRGAPYGAIGLATNYPRGVGGVNGPTKPVALLGVSLRHSSGWGGDVSAIPGRDGVVMFNLTREF